MEKNYTGQVLLLTILVLILLTGLSLLPGGIALGELELRKMDIFADVRDSIPADIPPPIMEVPPPDTTEYFPLDTLVNTPQDSATAAAQAEAARIIPPKDSVSYGKIIEDYSYDQHGLSRFFMAVDSISKGRTVRIAWYGDSFVEGDILIGDLRDSLQTAWGGAGVGFVPITSEVAQFKRTLKHDFKGWTAFSIIKKSENRPRLGLSGYAYQPEPDARVHYEGARYFKHTDRWNQVRLFYTAQSNLSFSWQNGSETPHLETLPEKTDLGVWKWLNNSGSSAFTFKFPETTGLLAYGATLESGPGIYIDNFSVRGNSGGPLKLLDPAFVRQFDAIQKYDLIVLQVGLNAVTNSLNNIHWYEAELDRTFKHLKACFPGKPILIVSVGDRGCKVGTEIVTMRGVPAIVQMQRNLARKHGLLFFDLFWGMGGPNTMPRLAYHRPRLANTDYTHLTHEGGKVVGIMFAKLFLQERTQWQTKNKVQ